MSIAKITLIGMYNYEPTLFNGIVIDSGETLNRETVVAQILAKCGEFETLYADANFMKFMVENWWTRWKHTFYRWSRALSIDYAPLENYDRQESFSRSHSGTEDTTLNITGSRSTETTTRGSSTETTSGTDGSTVNDTINRYRSAYDETTNPTLTDRETDAKTQSDTHSQTVGVTGNGSENGVITDSAEHVTDKDIGFTETETNRIHGNIGVTTSQQMLQSELELYRDFQIYDQIADTFKLELCVFVYS